MTSTEKKTLQTRSVMCQKKNCNKHKLNILKVQVQVKDAWDWCMVLVV